MRFNKNQEHRAIRKLLAILVTKRQGATTQEIKLECASTGLRLSVREVTRLLKKSGRVVEINSPSERRPFLKFMNGVRQMCLPEPHIPRWLLKEQAQRHHAKGRLLYAVLATKPGQTLRLHDWARIPSMAEVGEDLARQEALDHEGA